MSILRAGGRLVLSSETRLSPYSATSPQRVACFHLGQHLGQEQEKTIETKSHGSDVRKKRKGKSTSALISTEINQTFKELKGRVFALRARELRILAGNLTSKDDPGVTNPAQILDIKKDLTCSKCGKIYKSKHYYTKHVKNCKIAGNQHGTVDFEPGGSGGANKTTLHEVTSISPQQMSSLSAAAAATAESTAITSSRESADRFQSGNATSHPHVSPTLDLQENQPSPSIMADKYENSRLPSSECQADETKFSEKIGQDSTSQIEKNKKARGVAEKSSTSSGLMLKKFSMGNGQTQVMPAGVSLSILVSYFDVYLSTMGIHNLDKRFRYLLKVKEYTSVLANIQLYNIVLRGWARKGNFSKFQDLWREMITEELNPDINSYISSIIVFSECDPSKNFYKSMFRNVLQEFEDAGHTVEKALRNGNFQGTDRKMFLRSIDYFSDTVRDTKGHYKDLPYSLPLLQNLPNDQSLLKSQVKGVTTHDELMEKFRQQLSAEVQGVGKVTSIFADYYNVTEARIKFTDDLFAELRKDLISRLERFKKNRLMDMTSNPSLYLGLFMFSVSTGKQADILLQTTRGICDDIHRFSGKYVVDVGNQLNEAYSLESRLKGGDAMADLEKVYKDYMTWYCAPEKGDAFTHRAAVCRAMSEFHPKDGHIEWPYEVRYMVGCNLREFLVKNLKIQVDSNNRIVVNRKVLVDNDRLERPTGKITTLPAIYKVSRARNQDELKLHPQLHKLLDLQSMKELKFFPSEMPMICPPLPWISIDDGASLCNKDDLMKVPPAGVSSQKTRIRNLPLGQLDPVLDAVNQLGALPWRVDKDVLELAMKVFLSQSDPEVMDILQLPLHPSKIEEMDYELLDKLEGKEKEKYMLALSKKKRESYSLWCSCVYRLSLACHFKEDILWFPHKMDFRGRLYPISPHLSHMGNDLSKAILMFANGKPLGKNGLMWLKLHCINLTGLMKRKSLEERLKFAEENLDLILDSANNPLDGKRWFLESDEPWLTFTACKEIRNALQCPDGPENYISHLPIHQDGSCNGLQHYAAIGRDLLGAAAVNLVPADEPQDVYSEIAALVEQKRSVDAAAGLHIAQHLEGHVNRKVIKQTVMTTVYGVTSYGAKKQISRQLEDISEFPDSEVAKASAYLATKVFQSLNEMFTASQEIQNWLTECAKVISSDCLKNVQWVTPIGLPVEQPYSSRPYMQLNPITKHDYSKMEERCSQVRVNKMKHRNGFPPNLIHSLDASHLMLTSLHLWRLGVNYASVHDCYWTHACDVEVMNRVCREEFVKLHSSPILENLSKDFLEKYLMESATEKQLAAAAKYSNRHPDRQTPLQIEMERREMLFKKLPIKGKLDLNVVKDSTYFFS